MALQHLHLLVDQVVGGAADRRLHGQQQQHVEQMVLDDVADGADLVVELAAALDAEILGHGDLHALDVIAVPDRLEEGVGEAEIEQVLDRFLAEIVVDAEDRLFVEHQCSTRFSQRADCRSWPKGFSTISRAPCAVPDCSSPCTTVSNMVGGTAM